MNNKFLNEGKEPFEPCAEKSSAVWGKNEAKRANKKYYKLGKMKIRCKAPQTTFDGKELTTTELRKLRT